MSDKKFIGVLLIILSLMIAITLAHFVYIYKSYQQTSIIYFISKELW